MVFLPNTVFAAFSFIGFILCMIPLTWHLQAWNIGTCSFMIWVGIGCLNFFINAVMWNGRLDNYAPVWCDISVHIIMALGTAIPVSSLCINRRLYYIATSSTVHKLERERRREILVDLLLCIGVPIISVIVAYVPQGNRFNILEDYGCIPAMYATWVMALLYICPTIAIGCISAVYCVLSILAFRKRRTQFAALLSDHSGLSQNRYFRLMSIAAVDLIFTIPLAVYSLALNTQPGFIAPWISWADTHFDFGNVYVVPKIIWEADRGAVVELNRWILPFSAFVFFAVFGATEDARRKYAIVFKAMRTRMGWSAIKTATTNTIGSFGNINPPSTNQEGTLPIYIQRHKIRQISFDTISISDSFYSAAVKTPPQIGRPISQIDADRRPSILDLGSSQVEPTRVSIIVTPPPPSAQPASRFSSTTSMALEMV